MAAVAAAKATAGPAPPRLTIRPLAEAPRLPPDFEDSSWAALQAAVRAVLTKAPLPGGSQEEVYRLVEAMCRNGLQERLAERLQAEVDRHVGVPLAALLPLAAAAASRGTAGQAVASQVSPLLQGLDQAWRDHCAALGTLCGLFLYLDRTYICLQEAQSADARPRSLWDRGVELFSSRFSGLPEVLGVSLQDVLDLVDAQRCAASAATAADGAREEPLLVSLVSMYSRLGIYEQVLEPRVLERTSQFYNRESQQLLARISTAEYLAHCERRLVEERFRSRTLLELRTEPLLLARVREELLGRHAEQVLEAGFEGLVESHAVEDLTRLHSLFQDVCATSAVRKAWGQAIKRIGGRVMAVNDEPEETKGIVPALINLHARLGEIQERAFQGSTDFAITLKDSFQGFLNAGAQNLPAKLLARHTDEVLRAEKACGDEEMEESVDRIVGIFQFISAKDAFEAFYKKDLAKRLLLQRSSSADAEALMLQRLRAECGGSFTSKLEGMLRDVDLSKGLVEAFTAREDTREILVNAGFEFAVAVLTSGLWPVQPPSGDISYPAAPVRLAEQFASFYGAQHTGRSLRWCPVLGQCTLRATYEGEVRKELVVSHLQAVVLLLFNSADSMTCSQIAAATRMGTADLHRTLQSLALHKTVKLLIKEPKGREVGDSDVFAYNSGFAHKLYRVTVPQISAKEQREEEANVEQHVYEDRQHELDAAVVRVMKAKKRLSHQQLLSEIFKVVNFPVPAVDAKKRIESLIEREYLERDLDEPSTYKYLA